MSQKLLNTVRLLLVQSRTNLANVINPSNSYQKRAIHITPSQRSLDEFFDDPKNYGENKVRSGRPWRRDELRLKSNSDLHKLWFVLYKERNMLYTMQEAAKEDKELFPSPERIDKVEESMGNLEEVVRERNKAYWQLEVSPCASGERLTVLRRDIFGRHRQMKCSQHIVPYQFNSKFRNIHGPGKYEETDWFFKRYREQQRSRYNGERSRTAKHIRNIFRRFPEADVDHIAESHPEFPPGYVKHLKENHLLYDDVPSRMTEKSVRFQIGALNNHQPEDLLK